MVENILRKQHDLCNKRETKEGQSYHYCYEECSFCDDPYTCQIPKFIRVCLSIPHPWDELQTPTEADG